MPKIKNFVQRQNLANVKVWIDDSDPNSRYFQVSQVPEILTGGKNAFLIAGSPELIKTTEVKIELLDVDGNPIFLQPIRNYQEGQSRIISIEIYEDTPPGIATLTILGHIAKDSKGNTPPRDFANAYNVKWQKQIVIAPNKPNISPIRLYQRPSLSVKELLVPYKTAITGSSITMNTGSVRIAAIVPSRFDNSVSPIVTIQSIGFDFIGSMIGGTFAASINGIPFSASIIDIYNNSSARLDKTFLGDIPPAFQTSNFSIRYTGETDYVTTALSRSYADISLNKLTTFSGDIARSKIYLKSLDQPGDYQIIADLRLEASELTVTQSVVTGQDVSLGVFSSQEIIDSYWLTGTIESDSFTPNPSIVALYDSSILLNSTKITSNSSFDTYFGLIDPLTFYEGLEYTFSGSLYGQQIDSTSDTTVKVYLFGSAFPSAASSPLGQLIGQFTISKGGLSKRFDAQSINFVAGADGEGYLRFVLHNGGWNLSNLKIISSAESGFNPDQVRVVTPVIGRRFEHLQFKAELFDVNSNLVPVIIESEPLYFDGGNYVFKGDDHRIEGGISILASGSNPTTAIKLTATGFKKGTEFLSGSAIIIGSGSFGNANTPFLVGSTMDGKPFISIADKLTGFIDETTGKFVLNVEGDFLVGSGSNKFDVRSLLPRNSSVAKYDRVITTVLDADDIRGNRSVSTGTWDKQIARMGKYTRGINGYIIQPPATAPSISSSLNPYVTGSIYLATSGTISVPLDQKIFNDTLYGDMNILINNGNVQGGVYQMTYQLSIATSWAGFPAAGSVGQVLISDDRIYAVQEGSYSPDPIIKYPIPIPEDRNNSTTLYYLLSLTVNTTPTV